jgi:hypothetical protein
MPGLRDFFEYVQKDGFARPFDKRERYAGQSSCQRVRFPEPITTARGCDFFLFDKPSYRITDAPATAARTQPVLAINRLTAVQPVCMSDYATQS